MNIYPESVKILATLAATDYDSFFCGARERGWTAYGIAKTISDADQLTDNDRKKIETRWQRWLKGNGLKTLTILESDLAKLGYQLGIKKIED